LEILALRAETAIPDQALDPNPNSNPNPVSVSGGSQQDTAPWLDAEIMGDAGKSKSMSTSASTKPKSRPAVAFAFAEVFNPASGEPVTERDLRQFQRKEMLGEEMVVNVSTPPEIRKMNSDSKRQRN